MLEGIRRYQYSWQVQVPFAALALVMAFWGFGGGGLFGSIHPIATVNGEKILGDQVDREATQLRATVQQIYGANAQAVLKNINIRQEAVERLIEEQLIGDEARHLGISISDVALQDKIAKEPVFQRDGQFDFDTYQDVLRNNNLLPVDGGYRMDGIEQSTAAKAPEGHDKHEKAERDLNWPRILVTSNSF